MATLRASRNNFRHMSSSPQQVTHLSAAQQRIAEERLLRAIADQSRDIIMVVRADGTIAYCSLHAERVLGYAPDTVVGKQAFDYIHPEDAPRMSERFRLLVADPSRSGRFHAEYRLRHRDGSWRWFEAVTANLLDDPAVGGILLNIRDITDRKQTQFRLERAEEALRHSEMRYRTVAEFTPGFIQECEISADGCMRFAWVSEGFEHVFGAPLPEFEARGGWPAFVRREDHESVQQRLATLLRGEQTEAVIRIVDAQGNERWLLTINRPVGKLPDGGVTTLGAVYDITKRKRAELELVAANARRAAIQDVALDCIIVMNHEGRIVEFNPAAERTFGYTRAQVIGELLSTKLMPERFRARHEVGLVRYQQTGESRMFGRRIEIVGQRANGEEFPCELEIAPVMLGESPLFTSYLRDITKRKAIEQRLRENEALLRAVTDSVPDWLLMLDLEARIRFINRPMLGIAEQDLVGCNALDHMPEAAREVARAAFRQVIETRAPHVYEYRDWRGGEQRWFENRIGPVLEDGRIVGMTVATSEITARRRGEEALRTQARILDTMREGVLLLDSRGVIRLVNTAMARLSGYQPRELVGRQGALLSSRAQGSEEWSAASLGRRLAADGSPEFEYECLRRDGSTFMAAVVLTPIEIGGEQHVLAVIEDITQRRELEREIIEIANREQRRIGSDLHDGLGQELTGIALMLRGLTGRLGRESEAATTDAEEIVGLVNKAIENTRQLARGLSPVSIERGGLPFALRALATRTTDMYGCSVRFRSKIWPQLTLDASASNHLFRIVQEAITNAVRHGHATEVTLDLQVAGQDVKLAVTDNGGGLPAGVELAQGMGMKIMRYRANIVGGRVEIAPCPEGGVQVRVSCRQPPPGEVAPSTEVAP